jgi:hypothetical protein
MHAFAKRVRGWGKWEILNRLPPVVIIVGVVDSTTD